MEYYPKNYVKKDRLKDCRMCDKYQPLKKQCL